MFNRFLFLFSLIIIFFSCSACENNDDVESSIFKYHTNENYTEYDIINTIKFFYENGLGIGNYEMIKQYDSTAYYAGEVVYWNGKLTTEYIISENKKFLGYDGVLVYQGLFDSYSNFIFIIPNVTCTEFLAIIKTIENNISVVFEYEFTDYGDEILSDPELLVVTSNLIVPATEQSSYSIKVELSGSIQSSRRNINMISWKLAQETIYNEVFICISYPLA